MGTQRLGTCNVRLFLSLPSDAVSVQRCCQVSLQRVPAHLAQALTKSQAAQVSSMRTSMLHRVSSSDHYGANRAGLDTQAVLNIDDDIIVSCATLARTLRVRSRSQPLCRRFPRATCLVNAPLHPLLHGRKPPIAATERLAASSAMSGAQCAIERHSLLCRCGIATASNWWAGSRAWTPSLGPANPDTLASLARSSGAAATPSC